MPAFSSLALGIGGALSAGAGVAGHLANMSAQDRAALLQEKGVQEWLKINVPDPEKQKLALERFVSSGEIVPELEAPLMAVESEMKKIAQDPRLKESRLRALSALEEEGYGGEGVEDAAARQQALIESGAANRGRQQAIVSDMERRGQLGSGLELAARLDAQQAEGDRLASQSLGLEQDRRQRALNAMIGAGDLAGDIQGDEYAMASDAARAADAINLFNTQNLQSVGQRNVDRANDANMYNLQNKQRIADENVKMGNFQQQYNKELAQQNFQNQAARASGLAGQYGAQAQNQMQAGQNAAQMWGNVASGVGATAQGAARLGQQRNQTQPQGPYSPDYLEWMKRNGK